MGYRPRSSSGVKLLLSKSTSKLTSETSHGHRPSQEPWPAKVCWQSHSMNTWRHLGPRCTWAKLIWCLRHQKISWKDAQTLLCEMVGVKMRWLVLWRPNSGIPWQHIIRVFIIPDNEKLINTCQSWCKLLLQLHKNHLGDSSELNFSYFSDSCEIWVPISFHSCTHFKGKCF